MPFNALLFDFNGLIIDDEAIHGDLFQKVLREEEITLTDEDYWNVYLGYDDKGLFEAVFKRDEKKLPPKKLKELIGKKADLYLPALKKKLVFFPGVIDFINRVKKNFTLAIVSGALRPEIEFVLKQGKINTAFSLIVSAEETRHGKPDPEGYLLALAKLKKNSSEIRSDTCLALEDSLAGIEAAQRARMKCAALTHSYSRNQLGKADIIVNSFEELESHFKT